MSGEKQGIKETLELLKAMRILVVAGAKVAKDKEVTLSDAIHLIDMFKKMDVLMLGFTGLDKLDEEWKDLDEKESIQILAEVWGMVGAARVAYKES